MSRLRSSIILDMGAGPSAYGRGTANILACSLETVVAEKMHTVIDLAGQISEIVTYLQERLLPYWNNLNHR